MRTPEALGARVAAWPRAALDVPLAVGFTVVALLLGHERPPEGWHALDAPGVVGTVATNMALVGRRRAPITVLALTCAFALLHIAGGYWPVINATAPMVALYTVASVRQPRTTALCSTAVLTLWILAGLSNPRSDMWTVAAQSLVTPGALWWFGNSARRLAGRNAQLSAVTEQLRLEKEENARRAVAEERVRIARELHDVVAHHMSVISVQAGLAHYVFTADPDTARDALGTISATSGEALEEMRRLLAVLRVGPEDAGEDGDGPYRPTPGLDRLEELAERVRAAGVPVELEITGERRPLAPGADLCAYRVVQEALTNVIKHARPARATVRVAFRPRRLTVSVTDDGRGTLSAIHGPPTGHGLIGMRERARIYGGTLAAGPRDHGGFEVRLTLPV
ncbi:sensor histidine kinase [Streptomyces sp. ISL-11]|uniref:sensor histidine kinase n=1 Tax=Streptomyces sp. ISL-11 TaxID=2819174 RepID=UPI00203598F2|nr:sensor histidine kinase [Streptomyces sp. ISL-11]